MTGGLLASFVGFNFGLPQSTTIVACLFLMLPFVWDGYQSYFGCGTTNEKRFVTGFLAGGALSVLLGMVL